MVSTLKYDRRRGACDRDLLLRAYASARCKSLKFCWDTVRAKFAYEESWVIGLLFSGQLSVDSP
jgi:hypothetical protein